MTHSTCLWAASADNIRVVNSRWPDSSSIQSFARDAVRLMDAETDEEKALAVFRFIRMWSSATTGKVPREPALGDTYIDDPLKVLNVYGAHHCDGLSRVMEAAWRSMGYRAEKLYRSGHTQADVFYEDRDGISRWHLFDLSQGWFVYDRPGEHIAGPNEIASDFSLIFRPSRGPKPARPHYWGMWNWMHAPHIEQPSYSPSLSLRHGEKVTFSWGNKDQPYQDNFRKKGKKDIEHGPYPVTFGNAVFTYEPVLNNSNIEEDVFAEPVNLTVRDHPEAGPRAVPSRTGQPSELVYRVNYPYIVSNALVSGEFYRQHEQDSLSILISVDHGDTWHQVWEAQETGQISLKDLDICREFDIYDEEEDNKGTPFGRYDYLVKIVMQAEGEADAVGIDSLQLKTTVQHNIFALPQLWPGENLIKVDGDFDEGIGLRISYTWQDKSGKDRRNSVWTGTSPYVYDIIADGEKWEDVRCRTLTFEAMPGEPKNETLVKEKAPDETVQETSPAEAFPIEAIVGRKKTGKLKSTDAYIEDLRSPGKQVQALAGLMVQRDKQAFEAVRKVAFSSKRFPHKDTAVQALYLIDPARAVPAFLDILQMKPGVRWKENPDNKLVKLGHWYTVSALVGNILAESGETRAVPHLVAVLENMIEHDAGNWETQISIIRSLGRLGKPSAAPAIRPFLDGKVDVAAQAVEALGELGDEESIPGIRELFFSSEYSVLKTKAAIALGRLGDKSIRPQLQEMLGNQDENLRAAGARALGRVGENKSLVLIEKALSKERFQWVRTIMEESMARIEKT
ncbi:MAG: HEAT repeat domain-containing protein [Desulfurivibrionaceae bacterium]